jgi:hypothetical protein
MEGVYGLLGLIVAAGGVLFFLMERRWKKLSVLSWNRLKASLRCLSKKIKGREKVLNPLRVKTEDGR